MGLAGILSTVGVFFTRAPLGGVASLLSGSAPRSSCPAEPGWSYWNGSCYFWDSSSAVAWPEAQEACWRFRKTELLYLTSLQEMVHSKHPSRAKHSEGLLGGFCRGLPLPAQAWPLWRFGKSFPFPLPPPRGASRRGEE